MEYTRKDSVRGGGITDREQTEKQRHRITGTGGENWKLSVGKSLKCDTGQTESEL